MAVTFDNRHPFTMAIVVVVPATMPAAIVILIFTAEATVIASAPVSVVTDMDAKSLRAGNGWRGYRKSGRKNKSKFPHKYLQLEVPKNNWTY
jgi:hypothetical protein